MSLTLEPAFVLHRRAYRETSFLVDLFTRDHGRVAAVARGLRKAGSRAAAIVQPFTPLLLSWYGKGELLTLARIESDGFICLQSGKNLRCGLYLNELLMRLLPKNDPHAQLFMVYRQTLEQLQAVADRDEAELLREKILRLFEKKLLAEIGYGLPLNQELKFNNEGSYRFDSERGFLPCSATELDSAFSQSGVFSGLTLNALLSENLEDNSSLKETKRLMRYILDALLGGRLESRSLFK